MFQHFTGHHRISQHCTALHSTSVSPPNVPALHRTSPDITELHSRSRSPLNAPALHRTSLDITALHSTSISFLNAPALHSTSSRISQPECAKAFTDILLKNRRDKAFPECAEVTRHFLHVLK
jgi:hypothetical protein